MRTLMLTDIKLWSQSEVVPAFDCLGDPVRRRILGPRINGERAGEVGAVTGDEYAIFQSGVSGGTCGCCAITGSRPPGTSAVDT